MKAEANKANRANRANKVKVINLFHCVIGLIGVIGLSSLAFSLPIDLSTKVSQNIEARIQDYLDRGLGKGKSAVFVSIELDYPEDFKKNFLEAANEALVKKDKVSPVEPAVPPTQMATAPGPVSQGQGPDWLSQVMTNLGEGPGRSTSTVVFPGYALLKQMGMSRQQTPQAMTPQVIVEPKKEEASIWQAGSDIFQSMSLRVKKISVRVLLDSSVADWQKPLVEDAVKMALALDPNRGDELTIAKVALIEKEPQKDWKETLIRDPNFWNVGASVLMILVIFIMGFALLATLRWSLKHWSETATRISSSGVKISGVGPAGSLSAPSQGGAEQKGTFFVTHETRQAQIAAQAGNELGFIEVFPDKIPDLFRLLQNAEPERIAIVAIRLEPKIRSEFLKNFSGEQLAGILATMAQSRFVEPEKMAHLKEAIERRLRGTIGSEEDVLTTIDVSDLDTKKQFLETLRATGGELYQKLRPKIFLFEDLTRMPDPDLARVISQFSLEELVRALSLNGDNEILPELKAKVLRCLPVKSAKVVEEMLDIRRAITKQEVAAARTNLLAVAQKMLRTGALALIEQKPAEEKPAQPA